MICPRCGKDIADGSSFCNFCGEKILPQGFQQPTIRTPRQQALKDLYERKFTIPQLEEDIQFLRKKGRIFIVFFIICFVLTLVCLGLGILFVVLATQEKMNVDLYYVSYETPNALYVSLASLFFSLFSLCLVATIALPIIKAVVVDKKITKRKGIIEILKN